jgi:twinkle protein
MSQEYYDYQKVLDSVHGHIDEIVLHLFPQAKKQSGSWRIGGISGEKGSSLSISTKPANAGQFHDFQDPSMKGNAISLWGQCKGLSYKEAGNELARFLGISPEERMHMPKKRPAPKITRTEKAFEITVGNRIEEVRPLNSKSIAYANSRGITKETLLAARCMSTDTSIVFSHFDEDNQPVLFKCWSCDGNKKIYTNNDPVPVLFGKHLIDPIKTGSDLIICEGQWDALTWQQLGYPAVSIPSGVSNDEWIGEDWSFLNCFSQIYLDFDSDLAGQEAELRVRNRLGLEKCRSITYRHKDANDALVNGKPEVLIEAFEHARDAPIDKIVNPNKIRELVRNRMKSGREEEGSPFFLPGLNFHFRPYEITVWYGITSHGKSSILQQQVAHNASTGKKSMVSSFEQATTMTIGGMMAQYTCEKHLGDLEDFDDAYNSLTSEVLFFDSMSRSNPDEVVATMLQAHKQLGIEEFVIDNVMTLEVDRQDNSKQAEVADKLRIFAAQNPIHLHLVMHPRKAGQGMENKPPSLADIMGASEWSAMVHNVICVWRDVAKQQKINEMIDEGIPPHEIEIFRQSIPDGKVFVRKQRETGDLPMVSYFFDRDIKRAYKTLDDLVPYWMPGMEMPETQEE